jgi:hypothetical protein
MALRPDGGAFGQMSVGCCDWVREKSFLWESGLGWRATAGQLLNPRLTGEPRLGRAAVLVNSESANTFRCLGGSMTAAPTGWDLLADGTRSVPATLATAHGVCGLRVLGRV